MDKMDKICYIIIFIIAAAFTVSSCTVVVVEEDCYFTDCYIDRYGYEVCYEECYIY